MLQKRTLRKSCKLQDMTPEDAEALLNAIKEGEIPLRFDFLFNERVHVTGAD